MSAGSWTWRLDALCGPPTSTSVTEKSPTKTTLDSLRRFLSNVTPLVDFLPTVSCGDEGRPSHGAGARPPQGPTKTTPEAFGKTGRPGPLSVRNAHVLWSSGCCQRSPRCRAAGDPIHE